ncbi:hypothetical protein [Cognatishimia sp. MH4019]|uniref:hypothetical protein n=1 Tax=Cognatishimia sp. MH4019 TaxID=2854030 RepID=UPI001CD37294|nr:hypothetical protein [Cognatishimia sp. MH4019]
MFDGLVLTPLTATVFFVILVFCGRGFRQNWKAQEDGWVLRGWLYAIPVLISFTALAFVPMEFG